MSIDDLKKMDSHIKARQKPAWSEHPMGTKFPKSKPRWKETSTPTSHGITFNVGNFKRNAHRVISGIGAARKKLGDIGDRYPNLRDPSWMLDDDPFNQKKRKKR